MQERNDRLFYAHPKSEPNNICLYGTGVLYCTGNHLLDECHPCIRNVKDVCKFIEVLMHSFLYTVNGTFL